ncbi:MAG: DUF6686 family protein [Cyclobacteriaceae bacterium]
MPCCEPQILYQEHRICIAQCKQCHRISLYYANLLAGFSPESFEGFCHNVQHTDFDEFEMLFPEGEKHIVLQTCHRDIQFTFTRPEYEQLQHALAEAQVLLQVQQVLDPNK